MAECCRDWVVHLDQPGKITPYPRFLQGADHSLDWRGASGTRLPAFDGQAAPLVP